jgi:hypothetical protein
MNYESKKLLRESTTQELAFEILDDLIESAVDFGGAETTYGMRKVFLFHHAMCDNVDKMKNLLKALVKDPADLERHNVFKVIEFLQSNKTTEAADVMYDWFRLCYENKKYDDMNQAIEDLETYVPLSVEFAIAVLTASYPGKASLTSRNSYLDKVKNLLNSKKASTSKILKGLE